MRITLIILFSIIHQFSFGQLGDTLNVEYDTTRFDKITFIRLTVKFTDTIVGKEMPFLSESNLLTNQPENGLDLTCSNLTYQIKLNNKVEIFIDKPKYVNDIIELIPTPENRAKANRIYNNEFQKKAILIDVGEQKSTIQNLQKHEIILTFKIPLIIKSDTQLILKPFPIKYKQHNRITQGGIIDLKK